MSRVDGLRAAVTGLIGLAAAAEQMLMADGGLWPGSAAPPGSPQRWAAGPVIAHNTEFRRQQVQRLRAVRCGQAPPEFAEVDHRSPALYAELAAQPARPAASRVPRSPGAGGAERDRPATLIRAVTAGVASLP